MQLTFSGCNGLGDLYILDDEPDMAVTITAPVNSTANQRQYLNDEEAYWFFQRNDQNKVIKLAVQEYHVKKATNVYGFR